MTDKEILLKAISELKSASQISISVLQRSMNIGYIKAKRIFKAITESGCLIQTKDGKWEFAKDADYSALIDAYIEKIEAEMAFFNDNIVILGKEQRPLEEKEEAKEEEIQSDTESIDDKLKEEPLEGEAKCEIDPCETLTEAPEEDCYIRLKPLAERVNFEQAPNHILESHDKLFDMKPEEFVATNNFELLKSMMRVFINAGKASAELAQDECDISYTQAEMMVDEGIELGIIDEKSNCFNEHKVFMNAESFQKMFGESLEVKYIAPTFEGYYAPSVELLSDDKSEDFDEEGELIAMQDAVKDVIERAGLHGEILSSEQGPSCNKINFAIRDAVSQDSLINYFSNLCGVRLVINDDDTYGLEIQSSARKMVGLRSVLGQCDAVGGTNDLEICLGKGFGFVPYSVNLAELPNLLVEGGTASIRCNMMHNAILSLIYNHSPKEVAFLMCDFSHGEMAVYNELPHMLAGKAVTDCEGAIRTISWLEREMDRRYNLLKESGCKSIFDFHCGENFPHIVTIINEIPKKVLCGIGDVDEILVDLLKKGKQVGMHLIMSTQKTSADVLSAMVRCNVQATIAFATASVDESYNVIGCMGAESLKGNGDMIFRRLDDKPYRMQCAYVNPYKEVSAVCKYIKENNGTATVSNAVYNDILEEGIKRRTFGYVSARMQRDLMRTCIKIGKVAPTMLKITANMAKVTEDELVKLLIQKKYIRINQQNNSKYDIIMTVGKFKEVFGEEV